MTLTAHAIVGAGVARFFPQNPWLGFAVGFLSHFLLDAIPHWDYSLRSAYRDSKDPMNNDLRLGMPFVWDLVKVGADFFLGMASAWWLWSVGSSTYLVLGGAFAGMLPDFLQFAYFKIRKEPLISLQRFHAVIMHSKNRFLLNDHVLGPVIQIVFLSLFAVFAQLFYASFSL